jgi:hypothetical protein
MKKLLIFPTLILFAFACHDNSSESDTMHMEAEVADFAAMRTVPASNQPAPPPNAAEITKKVVKTGRIEFQSESVEKDNLKLLEILEDYQAYVENSNQSKSDYRITYNLTVRVPAEKYDSLFNHISGISERLVSRSSNIEDVTERYYDLKTRIKNKKALEARYLEILEKASAVSDILEIEAKLNEVRTDIERLEGQFRYLSKRVSLSTIHVSFFEVLPYAQEYLQRPGFGNRILNALGQGWEGFLSFMVWTIGLWPFVILLIGAIYLIRRIRRKRRQKNP